MAHELMSTASEFYENRNENLNSDLDDTLSNRLGMAPRNSQTRNRFPRISSKAKSTGADRPRMKSGRSMFDCAAL